MGFSVFNTNPKWPDRVTGPVLSAAACVAPSLREKIP
jgi:hypothetical protein